MNSPRRVLGALVVSCLAVASLSACSDKESVKDNPKVEGEGGPEDVLALAKKTLDETPGLQISIETKDLPEDVAGFTKAEGLATHQPAFDGTLTATVEIPVIAVDDKVFANLLGTGFEEIDPAAFNAPDPADLITPDEGFSRILDETTDVEEGETVRGGENNDETLVEYTGTVPGDVASSIIPSASGDFDATYAIAENGEVRTVKITGEFYADAEPNTYTLTFTDYGTDKTVSAPK